MTIDNLLKYNQSPSGDGTSTEYSLMMDKENLVCAYACRQTPTVL